MRSVAAASRVLPAGQLRYESTRRWWRAEGPRIVSCASAIESIGDLHSIADPTRRPGRRNPFIPWSLKDGRRRRADRAIGASSPAGPGHVLVPEERTARRRCALFRHIAMARWLHRPCKPSSCQPPTTTIPVPDAQSPRAEPAYSGPSTSRVTDKTSLHLVDNRTTAAHPPRRTSFHRPALRLVHGAYPVASTPAARHALVLTASSKGRSGLASREGGPFSTSAPGFSERLD